MPFPRDSELAVLWAHVNEPPPKLEAYPALDPVIAKALAKDPRERHGSCAELVEAARTALGQRDVLVVRDRRPLLLALLGALVMAGALAAGLVLSLGGRSGPPKPSTRPTLTPKVDSLQRIDPGTNKLVATVRTGGDTSAVAVGDGAVFVTNRNDRTVSRIDPQTDSASVSEVAGADPTRVAAGAGTLWVSTPLLTQLDPKTLRILATFSPGGLDYCGNRPLAVGAEGLWAVAGDGRTIFRITSELEGGLVTTVPAALPGAGASCGTDLAWGGSAVWVLTADSRSVLHVDAVTGRAVATIPLAFLPNAVAADSTGAWVADGAGNSVVGISSRTNTVVARVSVGARPLAVAVGEGSVWTANVDDGTVSRIDPRTHRVVATIKIGPNPSALAAGEGGVWVVVHPS